MKKTLFLIASAIVCGSASADEFDFELSLDFDAVDRTRSFSSDFLRQVTEGNTQELDVSFRWYIDGLSDERGPRGVAAFTNRASFVDFGLFQANTSADFVQITDDQTFNVSGTTDTDGFSLSGRHVFENWFV
ncbi:MAG: hypothetical protein AAF578_10355 [Pseudomonadota bacterium]